MNLPNDPLIQELARCLNQDAAEWNNDTNLDRFVEWDSLGQLSIIALVDKHCHKIINIDDLRKCRSVRDLMCLIDTYRNI